MLHQQPGGARTIEWFHALADLPSQGHSRAVELLAGLGQRTRTVSAERWRRVQTSAGTQDERTRPLRKGGGCPAEGEHVGTALRPDSDYTRTWSPSGEIQYATLADGTRLRYVKTGSGPTALVLLHTVRTQLDHFQLVIPKLLDACCVYAIDLPGMG